ncbi:MAG: DUF4136 domain-containing protein [Pseudomonadota bacterium]|nr:DUF4136 domain-containing protein [Pseudomonadota bacterium]
MVKAVRAVLVALGLSLILAACAPPSVSPVVTRFSQPSLALQGKTFTILPYPEQKGSLEFDAWASLMQAELQALGMAPDPRKGNYVVMFRYASGLAQQRIRTDNLSYGMSYCDRPFGGWCHGYDTWPRVYSYTVWPKTLEAVMYEGRSYRAGKLQSVWEGKAHLDSGSPDFGSDAAPLVQSLFINFPGPSGISQQYMIQTGP